MYLTQTDQVNLLLMNNQNMTLSDIISELIKEDRKSEQKKEMNDGEAYYKINNDVLKHDFNKVIIDGIPTLNPLISNDKLVHAFHHILVKQKIDYICGNPIKIQTDDYALLKKINELLGEGFDLLMQEWGTNACNKGNEYLHPYIDKDGSFGLAIVPSQQIIPIYDQRFQNKLVGIIRYYQIEWKKDKYSPKKKITKVELWDTEKTLFLIENDFGKYEMDPDQKNDNPRYHFYEYNTIDPGNKEARSWGKIPFIELRNNRLKMPDIRLYKTLIDNYDFSRSQFSNNLKDIQELFWILFGADETDLGEFVRNLKTYKSMKVPAGANVDGKKGEIPFEARDSHEDKLWEDIYFFGMGVNWKSDLFRNPPSGRALQNLMIPLDIKSNAMIREWSSALKELMYYVCMFINLTESSNYDYQQIGFQFDKTILTNELEQSQIAQYSKGIISDETIVEHHPWVKDSQLEMERLKKQNEEFENLDVIENE